MEIKKTNSNDITYINLLISRSKSYWNYDPDYLKASLPLIQISEIWLQQHAGFTLYNNCKILGFLGVEKFDNFWKLEHLWIDPEKINQGYGRKAIQYLCCLAMEQKIAKILLLPDPPAEKFYSRLGAQLTGVKVSSRIVNGPVFHEMVFNL
jgi:N-acetylglutamate synthase-like GNAT family acetyltransferase